MSKFDEALAKAQKQLDDCGVKYDADLLTKVAKGLGPSIYNVDASLVSFTDKGEMETVRKNFLGNKLGVTDEATVNAAIDAVAEQMKETKRKQRINVYYLLTKELGKEEIYG